MGRSLKQTEPLFVIIATADGSQQWAQVTSVRRENIPGNLREGIMQKHPFGTVPLVSYCPPRQLHVGMTAAAVMAVAVACLDIALSH